MPVYIVTGKLGGGKSLVSVARIRDYLRKGSIIATNLDLRLHRMFDDQAKNLRVLRVPDKPSINDLIAIGRGNESYDETKNGLLVLDECGTWFNSRNWSDKTRKPVNDWFLHARKLGWDVLLIIQNISILDSQARDAIAEHTAFCSRLDRLAIPYVGFIFKAIFGEKLPLPRVHSARVVYGTGRDDLLADRWVYRGTELFQAYDTKQLFLDDYPHGTHSLLTPWHTHGRYKKPWTLERIMRITKIHWKRFQTPVALAGAAFFGVLVSLLAWPYMLTSMQARAEVTSQLSVDETQPAVTSQPEVALFTTDSSVPVPAVLTVREQFSAYSIVAHVRRGEVSYYQVRNADGSIFTDAQLRAMGYRVFGVSECELMVVSAASFVDKATIWQPGCIAKPLDRTPVDLTQMPSLARSR